MAHSNYKNSRKIPQKYCKLTARVHFLKMEMKKLQPSYNETYIAFPLFVSTTANGKKYFTTNFTSLHILLKNKSLRPLIEVTYDTKVILQYDFTAKFLHCKFFTVCSFSSSNALKF